jgi:hypothetical protein
LTQLDQLYDMRHADIKPALADKVGAYFNEPPVPQVVVPVSASALPMTQSEAKRAIKDAQPRRPILAQSWENLYLFYPLIIRERHSALLEALGEAVGAGDMKLWNRLEDELHHEVEKGPELMIADYTKAAAWPLGKLF